MSDRLTTMPIPFTATRYRCPFCARSRSHKKATAEHIARCWHNPSVRSCKTCANYEPPNAGCGEYRCNCDSGDFCGVGVKLPQGGPVTNCEKWEVESHG